MPPRNTFHTAVWRAAAGVAPARSVIEQKMGKAWGGHGGRPMYCVLVVEQSHAGEAHGHVVLVGGHIRAQKYIKRPKNRKSVASPSRSFTVSSKESSKP